MSCNFCDIEPNISCSDHYGSGTGSSMLSECNYNTENHLTKIKLINRSLPKDSQIMDEKAIILLRCGIDIFYADILSNFTICVKHRKLLGLEWKQNIKCCNSNHAEISKRNHCHHTINFSTSITIIRLINCKLINPIYKSYIFGSIICKECFLSLEQLINLKKPLLNNLDSVLSKFKLKQKNFFIFQKEFINHLLKK
jgi:hypothetical protein